MLRNMCEGGISPLNDAYRDQLYFSYKFDSWSPVTGFFSGRTKK